MTKDSKGSSAPRVLIVTPEITYLPHGMDRIANNLTAKAGGLADVSAALISALFEQGGDVHVAIPDYRRLFDANISNFFNRELERIQSKFSCNRIHFAMDRAFFYVQSVYSPLSIDNIKLSLAFQREVINNIVPRVQPDLIHCNDWMTGLIPAMARRFGIPCLFTLHNIHTIKTNMDMVEDRGIDAAAFWQNLYFDYPPVSYEESRGNNYVDFLGSAVFSAHFVNTVSPTFLWEIIKGRHDFVAEPIRRELAHKLDAGCAFGILNAPDPSFMPQTDQSIARTYGPMDHTIGKLENKRALQHQLGLINNDNAPLFFWPSRLDPVQKGCQLLAEILYDVVSRYWDANLQIVFVADGEFKAHFEHIVRTFNLHNRVSLHGFDVRLEKLSYAASDFILMPSRFEPCGLPQMIAPIYGSLPVAHDTGGIHDTVSHLNMTAGTGNGFLFEHFDAAGLSWAIDEAMRFFYSPPDVKDATIKRIMEESQAQFTHDVTAEHYIKLYEKMLERPFFITRS